MANAGGRSTFVRLRVLTERREPARRWRSSTRRCRGSRPRERWSRRLGDRILDAIVSTTIASTAITPGLEQLFDRERPNGGDDPAFPSGHATQAFALATVVASHYEQRRVQWLAYGLATGVGLARISNDARRTSDVLAGAAIGAFTGRTVVATNKRFRITPVRTGIVVSVSW